MRLGPLVRLLGAVAVLVAAERRAFAADAEAERAFNEARAAMDKGRFDVACALFELSLSRERAIGTSVNLAICEAARGHYLKAKSIFEAADGELASRGVAASDKRRELIKIENDKLFASAPRVVVEASPTSAKVEVDGAAIDLASRRKGVLVDVGKHEVVVTEGERTVARSVVAERGKVARVAIELPSVAMPMASTGATAESGHLRPRTFVAGSIAAAGIAAGAVLAGLSIAQKSDVDRYCNKPFPGQDLCTNQIGADAAHRGLLFAVSSLASFGVAGVATGFTIGFAVSDTSKKSAAAPTDGWVRFRGTF